MLRTRTRLRAGRFLAAIVAAAPAAPALAQEAPPVVVELYTSQGCSSCPAADAFLGDLVQQPGIIGLGFHVDYWNYLGWTDPFSSKKFTYRQKEYAMSFRQSGVYTPQMVVQGRRGEVGSERRTVLQAIADARRAKPYATVQLEKLAGNKLQAVVTATSQAKGAEIWLALFDRRQTTKILRGENEGKTIAYHNVVREWRKVGDVSGDKAELSLSATNDKGEKRTGAAVIVQQPKAGPILGAALVYLD